MKKQCKRKSLINNKVAGLGFISTESLEHCGNAMVENLTEIFTVVVYFESTCLMNGNMGLSSNYLKRKSHCF